MIQEHDCKLLTTLVMHTNNKTTMVTQFTTVIHSLTHSHTLACPKGRAIISHNVASSSLQNYEPKVMKNEAVEGSKFGVAGEME
jgi:hypothetical protein